MEMCDGIARYARTLLRETTIAQLADSPATAPSTQERLTELPSLPGRS